MPMNCRIVIVAASLVALPVIAFAAEAASPPSPASANPVPADALVGRWKAPEGGVVVAISAGPGGHGGVVVESPEKPALVGKPMFRALGYDPARAVWTGEVFAVRKGEFVPAEIRLTKDGFELTAGRGFLSKKLAWTRG
ncbi:MAG: hypothetical protein WB493_09350 [Anaeromyxobacteraceae bacterium]